MPTEPPWSISRWRSWASSSWKWAQMPDVSFGLDLASCTMTWRRVGPSPAVMIAGASRSRARLSSSILAMAMRNLQHPIGRSAKVGCCFIESGEFRSLSAGGARRRIAGREALHCLLIDLVLGQLFALGLVLVVMGRSDIALGHAAAAQERIEQLHRIALGQSAIDQRPADENQASAENSAAGKTHESQQTAADRELGEPGLVLGIDANEFIGISDFLSFIDRRAHDEPPHSRRGLLVPEG